MKNDHWLNGATSLSIMKLPSGGFSIVSENANDASHREYADAYAMLSDLCAGVRGAVGVRSRWDDSSFRREFDHLCNYLESAIYCADHLARDVIKLRRDQAYKLLRIMQQDRDGTLIVQGISDEEPPL